jgi:excisionase family DNA binding protein
MPKTNSELSPLLSTREACVYVGVGLTTLYQVIIPRVGIVKVGRRTFVRRTSLDRYITANATTPTKPIRRRRRQAEQAMAP